MFWLIGILFAIIVACDRTSYYYKEKPLCIVFWLIVMGVLGWLLQIGAINNPIRDIEEITIAPLSVVKTNCHTIVTYQIENNWPVTLHFDTVDYWVSTNIMITYKVGRNAYNYRLVRNISIKEK